MQESLSIRPDPADYAPYYESYISKVPDGEITEILEEGLESALSLLRQIPESQADSPYAPGKWTVKEVVGHILDAERIFGYRALRFARNDSTALPGFDQDEYVRQGAFDRYSLEELAAEFEHVRRGNILMFRHFSPDALERRGVANGNLMSVRALAYIIVGHAAHHIDIIRTRYR